MRCLSYYGLSLALAEGISHEAIEVCELAVAQDDGDPDLFANLGWIYLLAHRRAHALAVLGRGLQLDPGNRRLRALIQRAEQRSQPMLPRWPRSHVLHRSLGRLHRAFRHPRRHPARRSAGAGTGVIAWEVGGSGRTQ
jgi:hypothetical protein